MAAKTTPIDAVFKKHFTAEELATIDKRADAMARKIVLRQLRKSIGLTQKQLAHTLGVSQSSLSQLESRDDFQLTTLRRVINAMGGELDVIARFPDRLVALRVA